MLAQATPSLVGTPASGSSLDLSALDGSNGFRLEGIEAGDQSGILAAGAGDVNGDGIGDLIVGAWGADPDGQYDAGGSFVVFGTSAGFAASLDLSTLDGTNGFRLDGIDAGDQSGISVAGAGDVNGDGIGDLIIGAHRANADGDYDVGESYVVFGTSAPFTASFDLSTLDGSNGFRLDGIDAYDNSGLSVASAGDVNGDGIEDLIVGASGADPGGNGDAGESYIVFGTDAGFAANVDLAALDGSNGVRLEGIDAYDNSGLSVAGAGDVNGDGIDDLIVGARGADPDGQFDAGESFVVFGTSAGFASSLDLSTLDGTNGFRLDGIDAGDQSGISVAGAGDVNGDGIGDLIIGAHRANADGDYDVGESYVVFGSSDGFAASLDVTALDGSNGFRLDGIDAYDNSGASVAGAGDVNGDGVDDLIVGAPNADADGTYGAGASYVIFGSTQLGGANDAPLAADDALAVGPFDRVDLAADNGAGSDRDPDFDSLAIVAINGVAVTPGDSIALSSGLRVTFLGGTEVKVEDPGLRPGSTLADSFDYEVSDGRGGSNTATVTLDFTQDAIALAGLNGTNGFRLDGIDAYDRSGFSVAGAGDVNGDGIDDLIVGAPGAEYTGSAGTSYVVFGTREGFAASFDLAALDGSNGFRLVGIDGDDRSGRSVAGAGDVNGDGIGDLIIGADRADGNGIYDTGESYVVFGSSASFAASLELAALDGTNGFRLDGSDEYDDSGRSVAAAGDINGDGIGDLIIGAPFADPAGRPAPVKATWSSEPGPALTRPSISRRSTARTASALPGPTRSTRAAFRSRARAISTATASMI